jgi:hypothetical protein
MLRRCDDLPSDRMSTWSLSPAFSIAQEQTNYSKNTKVIPSRSSDTLMADGARESVRRYLGRAAPGEYLKSRVRFLEGHMKVFGVAIVGAIALAVAAAIGLSFVQKTVAQAYSTGADRLDQQESVDFYGR